MNAPPLSTFERQDQLLRYIAQSRRVSVSNICDRFQVSEATARRDLRLLAEQGKIHRVHGVAISVFQPPPELPVYQRTNEYAVYKQRIGQKAAELVGDGETVFLGSGTTVLEVARSLADRRDLTVITNSLLVLNQLGCVDNPVGHRLAGQIDAQPRQLLFLTVQRQAKAASFDNAEQTKTEHVNSQMDEKANPDEQGDAIQANGSTAASDSENKNLQAKSGKSITDLLIEALKKYHLLNQKIYLLRHLMKMKMKMKKMKKKMANQIHQKIFLLVDSLQETL